MSDSFVYVLLSAKRRVRHVAVWGPTASPLCGNRGKDWPHFEPSTESPEIPWCQRCVTESSRIFVATTLHVDPPAAARSAVRAAQRAAAELPPTMDGLLTEEEHADLSADLARMANQRRRVEAESRDVPLGLYCGTCGSERIFPIPQLPDEPTPTARSEPVQ